jgi:c-di-GMP-binding flagellar brake protein YcgR
MLMSKTVKLGEILDLDLDGGSSRTKVLDLLPEERFTVLQPTIKGIPYRLRKGETVQCYFFRPNGMHTFQAVMEEEIYRGNLESCLLRASSMVERRQRRNSYRLPVSLEVTVKPMEGEPAAAQSESFHTRTVNISQDGMLFNYPCEYEPGTQFELQLKIGQDTLSLKGEVKRSIPPGDKKAAYGIAVRYFDYNNDVQNRIGRYIMKQQIKSKMLDRE